MKRVALTAVNPELNTRLETGREICSSCYDKLFPSVRSNLYIYTRKKIFMEGEKKYFPENVEIELCKLPPEKLHKMNKEETFDNIKG